MDDSENEDDINTLDDMIDTDIGYVGSLIFHVLGEVPSFDEWSDDYRRIALFLS